MEKSLHLSQMVGDLRTTSYICEARLKVGAWLVELQVNVWMYAGAHPLGEQLVFLQMTWWELQLANAIKVALLFIIIFFLNAQNFLTA